MDELMRLGQTAFEVDAAAGGEGKKRWEIDDNETIHVLLMRGGAASRFTITDWGGDMPTLYDYAAGDGFSDSDSIEGFDLRGLRAGPLTLRLEAGSTDAAVMASVFFTNGRRLFVHLDPARDAAVGEPIRIAASIRDRDQNVVLGHSGSYSAQLRLDGVQTRDVALFDDGSHGDEKANDGIFESVFGQDTPLPEGHHELFVQGVQDVDTFWVDRCARESFYIRVTGASFSGVMSETPVDTNGNGLYDELRLEQEIRVTGAGTFHLSAMWGPQDGQPYNGLHGTVRGERALGAVRIVLSIPGEDIVRLGKDGPWKISNIRLTREDVFGDLGGPPDHITHAYALDQFEHPAGLANAWLEPDRGSVRGGIQVTVMGSGLRDVVEVLIAGRPATFEVRDDEAIGLKVRPADPPLTDAESSAGGRTVDVELRTKWSKLVVKDAFHYLP